MTDRAAPALGEGFLLVYGADAGRWAKRHGIEPFTTPCESCGAPKTTTIPLAFGAMRGLAAHPCECGCPGLTYCLVGMFDQRKGLGG